VKKCTPKKIYTFHGFAIDFAKTLRKLGFDAEPLLDKDMKREEEEKDKDKDKEGSSIISLDSYMNA
nr:hypothetical protein [Thermoproteota archaeon]